MSDIPPGWSEFSLDSVLDFREGPGILARDFREIGVPLIRLAGLRRGASPLDGCNFVDPTAVERRWKQFRVQVGDVLLSTSASLGEVAVVDETATGAIPYTGIIRFRPRDGRVLREFVQYALRAPSFLRQVEAMGVGSVMRHFGPFHLRQMTVNLPPPVEQRGIAEVLGVVDRAMVANDRVIRALGETIECHFRLLAEADDGWPRIPIGEAVSVRGGATPPTKQPRFWIGGNHAWATPRDLSRLESTALLATERTLTDAGIARISSGLLPEGTVLLSSRAPIGYLAIAEVRVAVNQGMIAMVCDGPLPNYYVWQWAAANMAAIEARANGSTFQEISKANFRPIPVPIPPAAKLSEFMDIAHPLYRLIVAKVRESRRLAAVRDVLLPALLAGALSVRQADIAWTPSPETTGVAV